MELILPLDLKKRFRFVKSEMELEIDEEIIRKARANHLQLLEGVGGSLLLTNRRLFFKSHMFNVKTREISIPLEDIIAVATKSSDFISKKLQIFLGDGSIEEFIVNHRKTWVKEIEQAIEEKEKASGRRWYNRKRESLTLPQKPSRQSLKLLVQAILLGICVSLLIYFFLRI